MYTITGLPNADGHAAILASAKDWEEVKAKATEFRKQGVAFQIRDFFGNLMSEWQSD
jgi:hypothetical protein